MVEPWPHRSKGQSFNPESTLLAHAVAVTRTPLLGTLMVWAASEAIAKFARIGATMVAARVLLPEQLGIIALVLAFGEILKALAENGVGQRIIAASDADLEATCNSAQRIFRLWCGCLFVVGCAIALGLDRFTGNRETAILLFVFSTQFLIMPLGLVSCFRAMRNGQNKAVAAIAGGQIVFSALMAVALLLAWPVAAAMILPRALTAPIWALSMRRLHPWKSNPEAGYTPILPFVRFGGAILGVEGVKALRLQADKLIIGGVLGMEALGIWFFAFNAGLGLATSFCNAFAIALFPHLCATEPGANRLAILSDSLRLALSILVPIIVLQAFLAPYYVPFIFGDAWAGMSGMVGILCLAAAPAVVWTAVSQWLRSEDRAGIDLKASIFITAAIIGAVAIAAPFGLDATMFAYLATATIAQVGAAILILRRERIGAA